MCAFGPLGLGLCVHGSTVTFPPCMQTGDPAFQRGDLLLDFGVETRQLGDHLVQGPEIHFYLFVAHGALPSPKLSRRPRVPESAPARSGAPHPAHPNCIVGVFDKSLSDGSGGAIAVVGTW